jgi:serine/threonine protein kinase
MPPKRVDEVEDHLSTCETCRGSLEATVGDRDWWQDLESALRSDTADSECEDSESKESVCKRLTALLGPTDDPSMLGRIGAYEIIGLLGYGGMGAVFKGLDRSLNRFVAIKMLLPHLASSGAARKRFAREAKAVAAVVDDHVMAIHCVDEWHGVPYLVMTYSRGITLQKRLSENGPLDVREILRVGMQTAKGLAAAHAQGIVHRDIKPANIFLDQNVERVQLMDFGLARAVDDASLTRTGVLAGTPQYMSPEQARAETVDQRSDLFSLGCVMYAMCTGHPPFRAESSYAVLRLITDKEPRPIQEINPDVPEWLCAIISKLMDKNASDRFGSALQVADILEACLAHTQQPSIFHLPQAVTELLQPPPPASETASRWEKQLKQFFYNPSPLGKLIAAGISLSLLVASMFLLLKTKNAPYAMEHKAESVQVRIMRGEDTVEQFTLKESSELTRLQAGEYTIEIDGKDDERQARCEAGSQFLTNSRIDQWENVFNEGILKMGKIVVTKNGKVATEAWFEDGYHLFRRYETKTDLLVWLWNHEYSATINVSGNQSQSKGTFPPPPAGSSNIHALPFAICSSIDFSKELIPSGLKSGKLKIYDYRVDGSKHIFDFQHTDESKEGFIELVFDEAVDPLLPTEVVFHKGTPYARHLVNTAFAPIAGLNIPLEVTEVKTNDKVTIEIFPLERLDRRMCRLSYYGLPEPDALAITDFGRNNRPWVAWILAISGMLLAAVIGGWLWQRKGKLK